MQFSEIICLDLDMVSCDLEWYIFCLWLQYTVWTLILDKSHEEGEQSLDLALWWQLY